MPDVNFDRQTYIIANSAPLYPSEDLFPSEQLYPSDGLVNERFDKFDSGSISVTEMMVDGNIQFGFPIANKFECTLYDKVDLDNAYIQVYQTIDNVETPIFCGRVDSAKYDRSGTYKDIVAYDKFYELSTINVADWWESFWENHKNSTTGEYSATLKEIRDSFLAYFGLVEDKTYTLVNDLAVLTKTVSVSHLAFKYMMKCICELSCVFPNITRDGHLEYISLNQSQTPHLMDGLYEADSSDFEGYSTQLITGIHFLDSNKESKYLVGTDFNNYTVDNILTLNLGTLSLSSIGTNMLNAVKTLTYVPARVNKIISDWTYKLGDRVVIDNNSSFIFENIYSGPQLVDQQVVCTGDELLPQVEHSADPSFEILDERIAKVNADLEGFEVYFENYKEQTKVQTVFDYEGIKSEISKTQNTWVEEHPKGTAVTIKFRGYGAPLTEINNEYVQAYYPNWDFDDLYLNIDNGYVYKLTIVGETQTKTNFTWTYQYQLESEKERATTEVNLTAYGVESTVAKEQSIYVEEHPIGTPITIKFRGFGTPRQQVSNADISKVYPNYAINDLYLNANNGYVYKLTQVLDYTTTAGDVGKDFTWTYQYTLEENLTKVYSEIRQTADSIITLVAGYDTDWDLETYTVKWKGTTADANDTIQVVSGGTAPAVNDYYLNITDGKLYKLATVTADTSDPFAMYDYYTVTFTYVKQLKTVAAQLSSRIEQTMSGITFSLQKSGEDTAVLSMTYTKEDGSTITLSAQQIQFSGLVEFTDLSNAGSTTINGANITTGSINCDRLNGGTINGQTISGGTITSQYGSYLSKIEQGEIQTNDLTITGINGVYQIHANGKDFGFASDGKLLSAGLQVSDHTSVGQGFSSTNYGITVGGDVIANGQGSRVEATSTIYGGAIRTRDTQTTSADYCGINANGVLRKYAGSSIRYKHDFKSELDEQFNPHRLYDLKLWQFKYQTNYLEDKNDKFYDTDTIGFLAEEVYKKYKTAASYYYDEKKEKEVITGWSPMAIIPPMLKLIQEQHSEIETLKTEVSELKEQMTAIINKIGGLE